MTYTYTQTETFNVTHARKLAAKVIADMHQCNRFYGKGPSEARIADYEAELVAMLKGGYVESYEFGFKTATDKRIVSWKYTVTASGDLEGGRSGGLYANADVANGSLFNFMTTNSKWAALSQADQDKVEDEHPVNRKEGEPPSDGSGYWTQDRTYSAGGVGVVRKEFRPYG